MYDAVTSLQLLHFGAHTWFGEEYIIRSCGQNNLVWLILVNFIGSLQIHLKQSQKMPWLRNWK